MYPEITPLIRAAIKRRYELIPYLYSSMLESHMSALAPQRWIGWGYELDPVVWTPEVMAGETQYWLGNTLLVGGVYEPGVNSARMYLPTKGPHDEGYLATTAPFKYLAAGQWITIESEWKESIPILAKVGGALVIGKDLQTRSPGDTRFPSPEAVEDDYRALEIFPPNGKSAAEYVYVWYEDDGIAAKPEISKFVFKYSSTDDKIIVKLEPVEGKFVPLWKALDIILPVGDKRSVEVQSGASCRPAKESRGRAVFTYNL
jgi:alpha-glucosidase (family GH31 glycosyl hydrolase)